MTTLKEKALLAGVLALGMPPSFIAVAAVGSADPVAAPGWLATPLDVVIPLVPISVWAYVSWYPASLVILFAGREQFRRLCFAESGAFVMCSLVHLMWPVTIVRPDLEGYTGASATALRVLYGFDQPVSLFPSFHAAVAPILLQLRPSSRILRVALAAWMGAICVSCVLTKQHYVLDVIAGLIVGACSVALIDAVRKRAPFSRVQPAVMLPRAPSGLEDLG